MLNDVSSIDYCFRILRRGTRHASRSAPIGSLQIFKREVEPALQSQLKRRDRQHGQFCRWLSNIAATATSPKHQLYVRGDDAGRQVLAATAGYLRFCLTVVYCGQPPQTISQNGLFRLHSRPRRFYIPAVWKGLRIKQKSTIPIFLKGHRVDDVRRTQHWDGRHICPTMAQTADHRLARLTSLRTLSARSTSPFR